MRASKFVGLIAGLALSSAAMAQFVETEPNDSKATANVFGPIGVASTVTGNSILSTGVGLDYYRLDVGAAAPGIWRWTSTLSTTTPGHTASIRGLGQTAAAPAPWLPGMVVGVPTTADNTAQTGRTPAGLTTRENAWYSFGRAHSMYYRVAGAAATTADYTTTFAAVPVTPITAGTFQPGAITINTNAQGHTTDTEVWVYDSNFNAIVGYGNDDAGVNSGGSVTAGAQAFLVRNYAPGTYYLALTNFNMANNQASPSDDNFRTGTILDFPDMVVNSSTTANLNVAFTISDAFGNSLQTAATKVNGFDIVWAEFTVVPAPGAFALLGLGGLAAARRRRA